MAKQRTRPAEAASRTLAIRAATAAALTGDDHDASHRLTPGVMSRAVASASPSCTGRSRSRGVSTVPSAAATSTVTPSPGSGSAAPAAVKVASRIQV